MKTIFTVIPLAPKERRKGPYYYKSSGNKKLDYKGKVMFPVNAALPGLLKKDDEVKLVLLMNDSDIAEKNADDLEKEFYEINNFIGAKVKKIVRIKNQFLENKSAHEIRLKELLKQLEPDMEIIADITFGQKTQSWVLESVFKFAEKFYDAEILNIFYGKIDFEPKIKPGEDKETAIANSAELFDVTSLYYLTSLTSKIEVESAQEALEVVDRFFKV
ncbi:MAG: hypothetical protein HUJ68_07580 [Clostridia bacterium]|nr:hypothetical protein [Clostridia bacterium]